MRAIDIPVELRIDDVGERGVSVSLLRTDRVNPHSLCFQFTLKREDLRTGQMCFVVYGTLRQELLNVLGVSGRKGTVGRSVPRKRKSKTVSG